MKRTLTLIAALAASSASAWQTWSPVQVPRYQVQPLAPKLYTAPQPWTATTIDFGRGFSTTTVNPPAGFGSINCQTIGSGSLRTTTCR